MAQWRDAGLDIPCVSVNLSPINFQNVEPGRYGRRDPGRPWSAAGNADARDDRRRDHERALGRDRDDERRSQARRGVVAGRFRNRLFEPQPAGASADPRAEDRPQLHARCRERPQRAGDRHHRAFASARACSSPSSPKASKPRGSAICWRNSDATSFRDFSTPRPCRLPRSGVGCLTTAPGARARCCGGIGRSLSQPAAGSSRVSSIKRLG